MSTELNFIVPGEPVAQPRHRVRTIGKRSMLYLPSKHPVHAFKEAIRLAAKGGPIFQCPVWVGITAVFGMPESWTKAKRAKLDDTPHAQKPDADNVAKAVLDALSGHWDDDCQVYELSVEKRWGTEAQTIISVGTFST